jgi:hypothetical protein
MDTCTRCFTDLWADELGRQLCRPCEDRTAGHLAAICGTRGLYAQLAHHLERGASSGGPAVSGSRTAPVPLRLEILNLQTAGGPVLGPLETWVRDWEAHGHAELGEGGSLQQRVDHACSTLRFNLGWAASHHMAADAFADEIAGIHRTLSGITSGEKAPRRIPVQCGCGQILHVTLDTRSKTCPGCEIRYGHEELFRLNMAVDRRAAA